MTGKGPVFNEAPMSRHCTAVAWMLCKLDLSEAVIALFLLALSETVMTLAKMAIIAITIRSSISVNALFIF